MQEHGSCCLGASWVFWPQPYGCPVPRISVLARPDILLRRNAIYLLLQSPRLNILRLPAVKYLPSRRGRPVGRESQSRLIEEICFRSKCDPQPHERSSECGEGMFGVLICQDDALCGLAELKLWQASLAKAALAGGMPAKAAPSLRRVQIHRVLSAVDHHPLQLLRPPGMSIRRRQRRFATDMR